MRLRPRQAVQRFRRTSRGNLHLSRANPWSEIICLHGPTTRDEDRKSSPGFHSYPTEPVTGGAAHKSLTGCISDKVSPHLSANTKMHRRSAYWSCCQRTVIYTSDPSPRRHFHGPVSPQELARLSSSDFGFSSLDKRSSADRPMRSLRRYRHSGKAESLTSKMTFSLASTIHCGTLLARLNTG